MKTKYKEMPMKANRFLAFGLTTSALLLAGVFVPQEAEAAKCTYNPDCINAIERAKDTITTRIERMQDAVSDAVDRANRDIVQAIAGNAKTIADSVSSSTEMANSNAADIEKRREREEAAKGRPKVTCGNTASSQGPRSGGSGGSRRASGPDGTYRPGNVSPEWKKAMAQAQQLPGASELPPEYSEEHMAVAAIGGCNTYADANSVRGKICAVATGVGQGISPYPDADVKSQSLLDGPQNANSKGKNISIPAGPSPERDARAAYLKMLNNAAPLSTPRPSELKAMGGRQYVGVRAQYDAAKSLAAYPSLEYDRLTTIDPETAPAMKQILETDAAFVRKYLSTMPSNAIENGAVSPLAMMDIEVERRTGNPDWIKSTAQMDPNAKAAEHLYLSAYSLRIQRDQLLAQHQTNILLGKILDTLVEGEMRMPLEQMALDLATNAVEAKPTASSGSN